MRIAFLLFWLVLFSHDHYYVSHVSGNVRYAKTQKLLYIGQEVGLKDSLIFTNDPGDNVALISPEKGRFLIRQNKRPAAPNLPEWLVAIADNIVPATTQQLMAARGGLINSLTDCQLFLTGYAAGNDRGIAIVDRFSIALNPQTFTDRDKKFFYLRYTYRGESINKRLSFIEPIPGKDTLFLLMDKGIYTIDGKDFPPDSVTAMTLYYYDDTRQLSEKVADLSIHFVRERDLFPELVFLRRELTKMYPGKTIDSDEVVDEIWSHLCQCYGAIDRLRVREILADLDR